MNDQGTLTQPVLAILPRPASISYGSGNFSLTHETLIITNQETANIGKWLAGELLPGSTLQMFIDKPSSNQPAISLHLDPNDGQFGQEGYALTVAEEGIELRAATPAGIFYAAQTLKQMLPTGSTENSSWSIPAAAINDAPRFPWRGCMLDPARHFIPKAEILKYIDILALHKMNVLHLHLTDDQGWRIEIKQYPELTKVGSQRKETIIGHARNSNAYDGKPHGGFYTQDELREIVSYAAERFITVVPEIDMPGHAQAAVASYPEVGVLQEPVEVATTWGIHPYLYNPTEEVLQFLRNILDEVLAIFPSIYIHVGGDEARKDQWQASPAVQARIKELGLKDEDELQSWFLSQIGAYLESKGRRMLGWDEILEGGLPAGATVMSWRGIEGGIAAAQAHHDVVMTPQSHVYLDHYQSNDPAEPLAIGGYSPLGKTYAFETVPDVLTSDQKKHILGAQCNIWTEYIPSVEHLEYMTFPRLIALAEVVWTPEAQRDFSDFCQRLALHEPRLTEHNIRFRPVATLTQEASFPLR
ncbi:beta-N-acetylhexosaminidase [Ktedonospora formicarum]|uniref:beta-N-acetylhexosaminidase n=1 Tax=Ktedonospora formicarum TaxID=2778364 RepID=A0A8J3MRZ8_9CHLR|nr:beta-N-acetylhexosaminidase [Ktedonospora formicarum]GHO46602.1 beta-N-acetylhexosaminidase [Ktedonospora formicarum]